MKSIGSTTAKKRTAAAKAAVAEITSSEPINAKTIIEGIQFDVDQKVKIAIVGRNGCGKSTLLRLLHEFGNIQLTSDESPVLISGDVMKHPTARVAYYHQHQQESLPYELSPLQHLSNIAPLGHNEQTLRAHLGSFGLSGDLALQQIGILSGGQKARVVFAELTLHKPHLLLLDEPTNNLDLDSIRALKEALKEFDGACVTTSHDMAFINGTCDMVYQINNKGKMARLEGGTEEYKGIVREAVARQRRNK
jgi:ATP-binding cassette subfamily F protein 3